MAEPRWVVAMGGGGFSTEPDNPLLDDAVLDLARRTRGRDRPRVCFLPTASGDAEAYVANFYAALEDAEPRRATWRCSTGPSSDIDRFLLDQDVIYVGGGNTENMLAVWRVHGVDRALRAAWEAGVVMAGLSAGSLCWFEAGTTDSYGPTLAPLDGGLGFVPGSHCPHYDGEPQRRPLYQRLVGDGRLPGGLRRRRRRGARLPRRRRSRRWWPRDRWRAAIAWSAGPDGAAIETELPTRYLG